MWSPKIATFFFPQSSLPTFVVDFTFVERHLNYTCTLVGHISDSTLREGVPFQHIVHFLFVLNIRWLNLRRDSLRAQKQYSFLFKGRSHHPIRSNGPLHAYQHTRAILPTSGVHHSERYTHVLTHLTRLLKLFSRRDTTQNNDLKKEPRKLRA